MITIYELKRRNKISGGTFFSHRTMKMWGDTLKGFRLQRDVDPEQVIVIRRKTGSGWRFNLITGRMVAPYRA